MTITAANIQTYFSEFAATDSGKISFYLNFASQQISEDYFGELYDQAHAYLTAHLLAMEASGATGSAALVKKKTGDLEKQWAAPASSATLGATSYGQHFKDLMLKGKGRGLSVLT